MPLKELDLGCWFDRLAFGIEEGVALVDALGGVDGIYIYGQYTKRATTSKLLTYHSPRDQPTHTPGGYNGRLITVRMIASQRVSDLFPAFVHHKIDGRSQSIAY